MKKMLCGTSLALMACATHAQSSVTLYGVIDAGVTYISNQGGSHLFEFQDGVNFGNRWGLKGTEDLGGGLSAVFQLENGFSLGTGTLGQGGKEFGRQAFVGLSSDKYGKITLGNQYDFINDYINPYNLNGYASVYGGHMGNFDRIAGVQMTNAIKYASADYNGLTFGGMYSFGNVAGNFHQDSAWSTGIGYKRNAFSAAITYTRLSNVDIYPYAQIGAFSFLGQTVATRNADGSVNDLYYTTPFVVDRQSEVALGSSYSIGKLSLAANFTSTNLQYQGNSATMNVYELGAMYFVTPSIVALGGYEYTTFAGSHWNQPTFGMQYLFSKRTYLYANVAYLKASQGIDANQGAGYYALPSNTSTQITARIAMIHTF